MTGTAETAITLMSSLNSMLWPIVAVILAEPLRRPARPEAHSRRRSGALRQELLDDPRKVLGLIVMDHVAGAWNDALGEVFEAGLARSQFRFRDLQRLQDLRLAARDPQHRRNHLAPAGFGFLDAIQHGVHQFMRGIARQGHPAI